MPRRMDITSFDGKLLKEYDVDLLREGVRVLAQEVMETEVSGQIGASHHDRSSERTAFRNGYRTRTSDAEIARSVRTPKGVRGRIPPNLAGSWSTPT